MSERSKQDRKSNNGRIAVCLLINGLALQAEKRFNSVSWRIDAMSHSVPTSEYHTRSSIIPRWPNLPVRVSWRKLSRVYLRRLFSWNGHYLATWPTK